MSKLRSLQQVVDLDKYFDEIDLAKNDQQSSRDVDGKYHPSALGDCRRKLYYAFHKTPPKHLIPPGLRRTFDHGHAVHSWVQDKLQDVFKNTELGKIATIEIEKKINDTDWAISHNLAGSADALITFHEHQSGIEPGDKVVYELKTSSSASWQSLKSPMQKHVIQANCYAACFGAKWILFDYYNKDKDVHKRFLVEADVSVQTEISNDLILASATCISGEDIPRDMSSWNCATCMYKYTCKPNED
jgi:CRISPR/Cas system-associated exonuclease Cas4 (RecB family)